MIQEEYKIPLICVTLGSEGSRAYYKDKRVCAEPFLQEKTIETTGAGDTFTGCMLNFILEKGLDDLTDEDLKDMLTFANAGAALITTRRGALKVMPEKEEIIQEILTSKTMRMEVERPCGGLYVCFGVDIVLLEIYGDRWN